MSLDLYSYQIDAIKRMKTGSILCGGVGSGKSRTALSYFFMKVCKGKVRLYSVNKETGDKQVVIEGFKKAENPMNLYIITTAKKRDSLEWEGECGPFIFDDSGIHVVVDSWNNISKYVGVSGAFFIFDEQRVVGYGAWTRAFLKITKQNPWILLSATPGDTWMDYIPVFVANGFYKNKTEFLREHVVFSRFCKFPKVDKYIMTGKLLRLRKSILVDMNYRKETIPHHKYLYSDYDLSQVDTVRKTRWNPYTNEPIENISEYCYVLRKVVNSSDGRKEIVKQLIADNPRTIIFYNFTYELDILREIAEELKIKYAEWNGQKHQDIPETDRWAYFVQYTSGSEGWNCTRTNVIIFYSQSYSYRAMVQASGRIDRVNTKYKDLYYYHISSMSSIDKEISSALRRKKKFNETNSLFGKEFYNAKDR